MATTTDVTTQPASGSNHIDALLGANLPGWNFLAPVRTTLYYTFSLASGNGSDIGSIITAAPSAFNASQEAAAIAALAKLAAITGISFVATNDGAQADLHFAVTNIIGASTAGICSSSRGYSSTNGVITSYTAESYIYLDNVEHAGANNAPSVGSNGFQILLHELGHAMGLKHSFEGSVQLPGGQDNTSNTLMSYTNVGGPYSDFQAYDIAALKYLYGGDGLGGALGQPGAGSGVFVLGTSIGDTLLGGSGADTLEGDGGNDTLNGGSGTDTAIFRGPRSAYTINATGGNGTISGPDGTDTLSSIENARFDDQTVVLSGGGGGGGNTPPTGSISVSGTLQQGAFLTASSTLADADGLGAFSYAWQSSPNGSTWTPIAGATSSSLLLAQAQVSLRIRAVVSYTDGQGTAESATSAATNPIANVNDAPTGGVFIGGTAQQNSPLSVSQNLADPDGLGTIGYKWQSSPDGQSWSDIPGATASSFTPGQSQVNQRLRVVASYTDGQGSNESVNSLATSPVTALNLPPTGSVLVSGTAKQGESLQAQNTLSDGDGLGTLISYRWQSSSDGANWSDIAGAAGNNFTLQQAQVGRQVRAVASYTDGKGTPESVPSSATAAVQNVNDAPLGTVTATGTVQQGQNLNAQIGFSDADGLGVLNYRWQSSSDGANWSDIAGASGANFLPAQAQVGRNLRVLVSYLDQQGTSETVTSAGTTPVANANDFPSGTVTITGVPRQGQPLSASHTLADDDGLGTIGYQWQVSSGFLTWEDITGASAASFTPGQPQVGKILRVVASYVDGQGTPENLSASTSLGVINTNDTPTGTLTINGSARPGQLLSATSTLADADGLGTLSYEWQSSTNGTSWFAIAGATGTSYTPGNPQIGQQLRVVARYTDGQGSAEVVPSAATSAVGNAINGTAGKDTLEGTAFADEINGLQGDDRMNGGDGNDTLNGGDGIDTAAYSRVRTDYTVGVKGATVQAKAGTEGTDNLLQVERIAFSDVSLAFDLSGQAGVTAKVIGAVFGAAAVSNTRFTGTGLQLLGTGMSNNDLMALALEVRLGAGYTPTAEVTLLYQNLLGITPPASDLSFWLGALNSGQFTAASLGLLAAETSFNTQNIGLIGLVDNGLAFLPNP